MNLDLTAWAREISSANAGRAMMLHAMFAQLAAQALARAVTQGRDFDPRPPPERWIKPAEAAVLLDVHPKWLQRRWKRLPFCAPLDGRGFRVSVPRLEAYMRGPGDRARDR